MSVDLTRQHWQEGHRRLEQQRDDPKLYRQLLGYVDVVHAELRRRVGLTFTLAELASCYRGAEAWARALGAEAVLLQTPPSFKASAEHATRIENFVAHAMRPRIALAWEWHKGSWPEAKAFDLCDRIGAIPVVDPLASSIPDAEFVYLRIGRPGSRRQIHDDDLKDVALKVRDRNGWVVFSNPSGPVDALRLLDML